MTEYTLEEAKEVAKSHKMNMYHREIMLWLIEQLSLKLKYERVRERNAKKRAKNTIEEESEALR